MFLLFHLRKLTCCNLLLARCKHGRIKNIARWQRVFSDCETRWRTGLEGLWRLCLTGHIGTNIRWKVWQRFAVTVMYNRCQTGSNILVVCLFKKDLKSQVRGKCWRHGMMCVRYWLRSRERVFGRSVEDRIIADVRKILEGSSSDSFFFKKKI